MRHLASIPPYELYCDGSKVDPSHPQSKRLEVQLVGPQGERQVDVEDVFRPDTVRTLMAMVIATQLYEIEISRTNNQIVLHLQDAICMNVCQILDPKAPDYLHHVGQLAQMIALEMRANFAQLFEVPRIRMGKVPETAPEIMVSFHLLLQAIIQEVAIGGGIIQIQLPEISKEQSDRLYFDPQSLMESGERAQVDDQNSDWYEKFKNYVFIEHGLRLEDLDSNRETMYMRDFMRICALRGVMRDAVSVLWFSTSLNSALHGRPMLPEQQMAPLTTALEERFKDTASYFLFGDEDGDY